MPREAALRATHLDWDRELCKMGCSEWVRWYRDRKGEAVYGCRIGEIPEKRDGCRQRKATKPDGDKDHEKTRFPERAI